MSAAQVSTSVAKPRHRITAFTVFLVSGLALFLLQFVAFNSTSRAFQTSVFIGLPLVFSLLTLFLFRSRNLNAYWPAYFSYATAAVALALMWLLDDPLVNWLRLDSKKPSGMALEKLTDGLLAF